MAQKWLKSLLQVLGLTTSAAPRKTVRKAAPKKKVAAKKSVKKAVKAKKKPAKSKRRR